MTAFRFDCTARPSQRFAAIQPMSAEDRAFWRERPRASAEREQRLRAKEAGGG